MRYLDEAQRSPLRVGFHPHGVSACGAEQILELEPRGSSLITYILRALRRSCDKTRFSCYSRRQENLPLLFACAHRIRTPSASYSSNQASANQRRTV